MSVPLDKPLPTTIAGCAVKTDFKVWLEVFRKQKSLARTATDNPAAFLVGFMDIALLVFDELPKLEGDIIEQVFGFLNGTAPGDEHKRGSEHSHARDTPVFDFDYDASEIVSSFWQAYRINVREADLHWFLFLDLLHGLPEDCALSRLIRLRTMDLTDLSPKHRSKVAAAKAAAAIPLYSQEELEDINSELDALFYDT